MLRDGLYFVFVLDLLFLIYHSSHIVKSNTVSSILQSSSLFSPPHQLNPTMQGPVMKLTIMYGEPEKGTVNLSTGLVLLTRQKQLLLHSSLLAMETKTVARRVDRQKFHS